MIDIDFLSEFSEPAEARPTKTGSERACILFISAPAINSIELSIRELIAIEPVMQTGMMEFLDADGVAEESNSAEVQMFKERNVAMGVPADGIAWSSEISELREQIHAHLQEHASLARSLGEGAKFSDYCAAARREKMVPLALRDFC
jgi:hypothetical protein